MLKRVWNAVKNMPAGMSYGEFEEQITWSVSNSPRRSRGGGGGSIGGWLTGLIVVLFLAYIGMNLVSEFAPSIGNLTYEGDGIGETIFGLVQTWLLPLALVGLLIYVVRAFLSRGR
jgi:hypothetical protein